MALSRCQAVTHNGNRCRKAADGRIYVVTGTVVMVQVDLCIKHADTQVTLGEWRLGAR